MNINETLKHYFGYDSLRPGQQELIEGILQRKDVLGIMPTGAGKSLCYQVPALMLDGITIVVSPLISLMTDQVKALNQVGVHAAYINSSLTENQIRTALFYAAQGRYKIIYVAPERLNTIRFLEFACQVDISMVTVDEAHCISQWGQDFRPSYVGIADFLAQLPKRPVVSAFTATATERVKQDIMGSLRLQNPVTVVTGFDRPNLFFRVVTRKGGKETDNSVLNYVKKHEDESGIIYCATKKNADKIYGLLQQYGIEAGHYHAGLSLEERKKNQDDFTYDRIRVMVATNAFGMGIDKSNVRYVLHYNMPQSLEYYYQEAGRAGRDGEEAECVLFFSKQDIMINKFLLDNKDFSGLDEEDALLVRQHDMQRLKAMEGYCRTTGCLRNYILNYFGEKVGKPCDNCGNCHREYTQTDMTMQARKVVECVKEMRGRYGLVIVVGTLMGADRARLKEIGADNYKSYGALNDCNEATIRSLISQLIEEGYLCQTDDRYSVLKLGDVSALENEDTHVVLRTYESKQPVRTDKPKKQARQKARSTDALTAAGYKLFEQLRKLRLELAKEEAVPPYIIFSDKTLIDMCVKLPKNEYDMLNVSGVGENKFKKYGARFLEVINSFQ